MLANLENPAVDFSQYLKGQLSFQLPRRAVLKKCSNYWIIVLTYHASKVMLKIPQARVQQYLS